MNNKKILFLIPGPDARGGITNYYYSIRKHLDNNYMFLERGARNYPYHSNIFTEFYRLVKDYLRFLKIIIIKDIEIVQTSTSLGKNALIRDSFYIFLAKIFRVKTIIFFRGWNPALERDFILILRKIIFSCDAIMVLNNYVKAWLINSGYKKIIYLETTLVDTDLLKSISAERIILKYKSSSEKTLLFMARIEKEKGIYEAINTFSILKKKYPNLKFYIAGSGRAENDAKSYVKKNDIDDVFFVGHISGEQKIYYLETSHIYFFPSYTEGMPNSVLEAMGFGLPIVTRNVGSLVEIIQDYENGFITDSFNPSVFAELISKLLDNSELMIKIALNNFNKAQIKFRSDIVAERIKKIFDQI